MTKNHEIALRIAWYLSIGLTLACSSILAPGAYILVMLALVCVGIFVGTAVATFAVCESAGPFGFVIAGDIIKGGLELMIVIARALLGAGSSNIDLHRLVPDAIEQLFAVAVPPCAPPTLRRDLPSAVRARERADVYLHLPRLIRGIRHPPPVGGELRAPFIGGCLHDRPRMRLAAQRQYVNIS